MVRNLPDGPAADPEPVRGRSAPGGSGYRLSKADRAHRPTRCSIDCAMNTLPRPKIQCGPPRPTGQAAQRRCPSPPGPHPGDDLACRGATRPLDLHHLQPPSDSPDAASHAQYRPRPASAEAAPRVHRESVMPTVEHTRQCRIRQRRMEFPHRPTSRQAYRNPAALADGLQPIARWPGRRTTHNALRPLPAATSEEGHSRSHIPRTCCPAIDLTPQRPSLPESSQ